MKTQDKKPHEKLMDLETAREKVLAAVNSISDSQECSLEQAIGRIISQQITSPIDVPPHDNSAMDGYAFCFEDIKGKTQISMPIAAVVLAGKPHKEKIEPGYCVRIMTGANIPQGLDTVIMQENVQTDNETANFSTVNIKKGGHIRHPGENIKKGDTVLQPGKRLLPADLGVLASLGIEKIQTLRKLRVAFFSTGDELKAPGTPLEEGQIYDSNRYCLLGVLQRLAVDTIDLGIIADDPQLIENTLNSAAEQADVVITSGGVSVGEADYVKTILSKIGNINLWKVSMKPGKPFTFGQLKTAVFFGLPGNPVSVLATYYQLVQPALLKMMGSQPAQVIMIKAQCQNRLKKTPGRLDFQRGFLSQQHDGRWVVQSTQQQGSHILTSMIQANCFIVLPAQSGDIEPGEMVDIQPFAGMV